MTTDNMEEEDLANRNRLVPKKRLLQSFNHFVAEEEDNPSVGKKSITFFKYYYILNVLTHLIFPGNIKCVHLFLRSANFLVL